MKSKELFNYVNTENKTCSSIRTTVEDNPEWVSTPPSKLSVLILCGIFSDDILDTLSGELSYMDFKDIAVDLYDKPSVDSLKFVGGYAGKYISDNRDMKVVHSFGEVTKALSEHVYSVVG